MNKWIDQHHDQKLDRNLEHSKRNVDYFDWVIDIWLMRKKKKKIKMNNDHWRNEIDSNARRFEYNLNKKSIFSMEIKEIYYPPKSLPCFERRIVTVGPWLSHKRWKSFASKPSRLARYNKCHCLLPLFPIHFFNFFHWTSFNNDSSFYNWNLLFEKKLFFFFCYIILETRTISNNFQ